MSDVPAGSGPRILIVDDDPMVRLLGREALAPSGYRIEEAGDGDEAWDHILREMPDLVLLDVRMPGSDGFEICRRIRAHPQGRHVAVVMITGMDDESSIREAYESGGTDFVTKPVNWTLLPHRVRYLLRAQEAFSALHEREAQLSEAQRIAQLGNWDWDMQSLRVTCSREACRVMGRDDAPLDTDYAAFLAAVHPDDRARVEQAIGRSLQDGRPFTIEHQVLTARGNARFVYQRGEVVLGIDGSPLRVRGVVQNITERKLSEERIHRLAYYDELTGLPNRHLFREYVDKAVAAAQRSERLLAVMQLDLDRFNRINDSVGHKVGDQLLAAVAARLCGDVRSSDLVASGRDDESPPAQAVARLAADEFLILLTDLSRSDNVGDIARRILDDVARRFEIDAAEYFVTAAIGIAMYPEDGADSDTLLKHSDVALHSIKRAGGNGYRFFAPAMNERAYRRLSLETQLYRALEQEEFELYFQPQVDVADSRLVGVEALLRWQVPDGTMVLPGEFIPLAEDSGLIVPIGEWVLRRACAQLAQWRSEGLAPVPMAVNLSARQFFQSNLAAVVERALADHGLEPALLELELTESLLMRDAEDVEKKLHRFKDIGLALALDDFGTGYSSMNYLKRFPLDVLKIDRSFIRDLGVDAVDTAIVRTIIALGRGLGLATVAEGVETPEQLDLLRRQGCDWIQGFLISRPLPADEFAPLLRSGGV